MIKVRLGEISNIQIGYSNKINKGDNELKFINTQFLRKQKYLEGSYSLQKDTLKKLEINKNSIIISSIGGSNFFEYGANHIGKYVGKGLYKIDLIDKRVPVEYIMTLLKHKAVNLTYEGHAIKLLKIKDLSNLEITIPNKKVLERIINMERYSQVLIKQKKSVEKYLRGIGRKINGNY